MGKVFSAAELTYDKFPKIGSHQLAAEQLVEESKEIANELGTELDLMVHGSVGAGRENRRSDLDFIAVFPDELTVKVLHKLIPLLKKVREKYQIPIEYNLISDVEGENGAHRIKPMFRDYLIDVQAKSKFVIGRPADAIKIPSNESFEDDMIQYLVRKRDSFSQAFINQNGEVDFHRLGRALEFPRAISRKYKQLGEAGLKRLYVAGDEARYLESDDRRITEMTEEVIQDKTQIGIEEYKGYLKLLYGEAISLAARLSFNHAAGFQRILKSDKV